MHNKTESQRTYGIWDAVYWVINECLTDDILIITTWLLMTEPRLLYLVRRVKASLTYHHSLQAQAMETLGHQTSPGKDRGANWCHSGKQEPCQEFREHIPIRTTSTHHRDPDVYTTVTRLIKNVGLRSPWVNDTVQYLLLGAQSHWERGRQIQWDVADISWCPEEEAANMWWKLSL